MEYGAMMPNTRSFGTSTPFSDPTMEVDFMDQLLFDGCWLESSSTGSSSSASRALLDSSSNSHYNQNNNNNLLSSLEPPNSSSVMI
ncbi:hypothetical protein TIFTF001_019249 [Ficus carica]|uniref:Uncharacterized protein n=1 Tax=Ficus carica TaxID=3494 RepID=A0AA88DA10_FICCA|nr:hypothetical protein TIFTF001_019249 [Ficus carica]